MREDTTYYRDTDLGNFPGSTDTSAVSVEMQEHGDLKIASVWLQFDGKAVHPSLELFDPKEEGHGFEITLDVWETSPDLNAFRLLAGTLRTAAHMLEEIIEGRRGFCNTTYPAPSASYDA